jgi:hypothetical protein
MAIDCEKVRHRLESFYDKELRGKERDIISEHLRGCEACSEELNKLKRTGQMLRTHYENIASSEAFSGLWDRVDEAIVKAPDFESEPLRDKLFHMFAVPRFAWAAAAVIAFVIVMALSNFPGDRISTFAENDCIIDSVASGDNSVMVYEVGDTGMKVIWVMDQQTKKTSNGTGVTT